MDRIVHQYHRAAQELWKFCWSGSGSETELIASVIDRGAADDLEPIDWWDRGARAAGNDRGPIQPVT
jgi:hypothetical protein